MKEQTYTSHADTRPLAPIVPRGRSDSVNTATHTS